MLQVSPPLAGRPSSRSSTGGSGGIEYTSLRDVLVDCGGPDGCPAGCAGGCCALPGHDIHDFDASNIGIRNQLVKHAASAYLQSAVVIASHDEGCLSRVWRRMQRRRRGRVLLRSCAWQWQGCAAFLARSARRVAAFVVDRVGCVWG